MPKALHAFHLYTKIQFIGVCGVRLHVRPGVGKARLKGVVENASLEGEEQDEDREAGWIQEHQAKELGCSHYPIYTCHSAATSATTSR